MSDKQHERHGLRDRVFGSVRHAADSVKDSVGDLINSVDADALFDVGEGDGVEVGATPSITTGEASIVPTMVAIWPALFSEAVQTATPLVMPQFWTRTISAAVFCSK